jgi:asparagine synthase (glutamine-hydrolysing)
MCGICGKYSANGVHEEELKNMMNAIIHRGPDDQGIYINGSIALGSQRLSIIDLESGKMPIANEDQSIWIVYNGEISNYKFLQKELQ